MAKRKQNPSKFTTSGHSVVEKWLLRAQSSASKKHKASRTVVDSHDFYLWNAFHDDKRIRSPSSLNTVRTETTLESSLEEESHSSNRMVERTLRMKKKDRRPSSSRGKSFLDRIVVHPRGTRKSNCSKKAASSAGRAVTQGTRPLKGKKSVASTAALKNLRAAQRYSRSIGVTYRANKPSEDRNPFRFKSATAPVTASRASRGLPRMRSSPKTLTKKLTSTRPLSAIPTAAVDTEASGANGGFTKKPAASGSSKARLKANSELSKSTSKSESSRRKKGSGQKVDEVGLLLSLRQVDLSQCKSPPGHSCGSSNDAKLPARIIPDGIASSRPIRTNRVASLATNEESDGDELVVMKVVSPKKPVLCPSSASRRLTRPNPPLFINLSTPPQSPGRAAPGDRNFDMSLFTMPKMPDPPKPLQVANLLSGGSRGHTHSGKNSSLSRSSNAKSQSSSRVEYAAHRCAMPVLPIKRTFMAKPARPVQVAGLPSPPQSPARATLADEDIPDHINLHIRGQVPSMPPSPCRKTPGSASSPDADAPSPALEPLYSLNEFKQMWEFAEEDFGVTTEEIEDGNLVRGANNRMNNKDSVAQTKAQYGRILPEAMDKVFREVLELKPDDVFVDIGHGIGNTMMQASYTFGCESRGVEVVENRNFVAQRFRDNLKWQREVHQERDGRHTEPGRIRFQHGRLEEPRHREFLTVNSKYKDMGDGRTTGTIKAFANNFNGVFADRCARAKQTYFLDHYISGIFALMKPGSIMVTLHPLLDMPPPLSVVTANRKRHKLKTSRDASFYELDQSSIGVAKDSVSWSQGGGNNKKVAVYRYKRVKQSTDEAVFLCSNLDCPNAQSKKPIPATKIVEVAGEQLVVVNHCDCGISEKSFRQRRPVDYTSVQYGF